MNTTINEGVGLLTDQEILKDILISQKHLTTSYNTYAGECVNTQLRSAMLNILDDEHCIQAQVFGEMQSKGWYQTTPAEQQKISQAKQKFPNQSCCQSS